MKRLILFGIVLAFAINSGFAQKTSTFKKIGKLYEYQLKTFFIDVFELTKTGSEMAASAQAEMEEAIYQAYLSDFALWAKFSQKYQGEKTFVLILQGAKEYEKKYETESNEYLIQFKKIQDEFVDKRLIWKKDELSKVLTKESLMPYITPVVTKFATRTEQTLAKLKSTYKVKKK